MLDFTEFQNEKKGAENKKDKLNKKVGRLKNKKLHVKLNKFNNQEQNTVPPDVGGSNYYN